MALKDNWIDLQDKIEGVPDSGSDISVEPINKIAHAVIELEENDIDITEDQIKDAVESYLNENPITADDVDYNDGVSTVSVKEALDDRVNYATFTTESPMFADNVVRNYDYSIELETDRNRNTIIGAIKELRDKTIVKKFNFANGSTLVLADNTEYVATEPIQNFTISYPTDVSFMCSLFFTIADSGDITITLPESQYIGSVPTFANGETWELNIKNGVVVGGKVE